MCVQIWGVAVQRLCRNGARHEQQRRKQALLTELRPSHDASLSAHEIKMRFAEIRTYTKTFSYKLLPPFNLLLYTPLGLAPVHLSPLLNSEFILISIDFFPVLNV